MVYSSEGQEVVYKHDQKLSGPVTKMFLHISSNIV